MKNALLSSRVGLLVAPLLLELLAPAGPLRAGGRLVGGVSEGEVLAEGIPGRDLKRYRQPSTEKFLLFTRRGIDMAKYPAVLAYLEQFRKQLEPRPKNLTGKAAEEWPGRKPGTYKWYEGQDSIDYWQEFEKPKVVFPDIANRNHFTFAAVGLHLDTSAFFIPSNDKYLLAVLNSKSVLYFFESISSSIRGGFLRWKKQYVELIPIPAATPDEQAAIAALVMGILAAKAADPAADTSAAEAAVDAAAAALYGVALPAVAGQ